ncbi:MaoC family dehydratase [Teichococcus vastitatis]|jgi:acyl dehydratase|uniref:MaoC family dehydratase N-terminal domain-containing protein n=1 Tax=Teichococcus vastitatis TaxID=2307076 RepID=A0ABS9W8E6_9PROT|nr:MaoC/PaaZ C-terminal domain-containing protein [Pseudoroseomonas vastitatis]MCI0755572.1 MaoC family dehydratase N-terminal domain-containing protein [Pseudoroseomonas vastitatis]
MTDRRLHFEEIEVGMSWETGGIQVTEGHILAFAGLSGDFYDIHMDDKYARSLGYPGRIAHGLLGLAMADGLKNRAQTQLAAIVSLGWRWRFTGPIFVGDRIQASIRVTACRPTRHADRGLVTLGFALQTQRGDTVQEGENDMMIHRRAAA